MEWLNNSDPPHELPGRFSLDFTGGRTGEFENEIWPVDLVETKGFWGIW